MIEWAPAVMALPARCTAPARSHPTREHHSGTELVTPSLKDTVPVGVNPDEPSATVAV